MHTQGTDIRAKRSQCGDLRWRLSGLRYHYEPVFRIQLPCGPGGSGSDILVSEGHNSGPCGDLLRTFQCVGEDRLHFHLAE